MNTATKRLIRWGVTTIVAVTGAMVASFEGDYKFAYPDPASPMARALQRDGLWQRTLEGKPVPDKYQSLSGAPWTACSGKTRGVKQGDKFTDKQCLDFLTEEIVIHHGVMRSCVKAPLALHEEAAMTSLFYWAGGQACDWEITKSINRGDPPEVFCNMLPRYNKGSGHVLPGLITRRDMERELCLGRGMWLVPPNTLISFVVD